MYRDFIHPNTDFQRAINLSLDCNNLELIQKYVPTSASVAIIKTYLYNVLHPVQQRASVLIGPYGKGKSHALLVVLGILSANDAGKAHVERVYRQLAEKVRMLDVEAAEMILKIRKEKHFLLPVLVNPSYLNLKQAFMVALQKALSSAALDTLMPDTYFGAISTVVDRWKNFYPDTYKAFEACLRERRIKPSEFMHDVGMCNHDTLEIFQQCHQKVLSGSVFQPMAESDVSSIYYDMVTQVCEHSVFSGLFVVFDEFSKYLELSFKSYESTELKLLQDMAEICTRSNGKQMHLVCIAHKAIGEYSNNFPKKAQNAYRAVEGRFSPIYFTSSYESSFELISDAIGRDVKGQDAFLARHTQQFNALVAEGNIGNLFGGYAKSYEEIIKGCFPMHPITSFVLMKLSEKVAQNERTLFTFLAEENSGLNSFVQRNEGAFELLTVDVIYDYFRTAIRDDIYNPEYREQVLFTDALAIKLSPNEQRIIKSVTLFKLLGEIGLPVQAPLIRTSLQMNNEDFGAAITSLERNHVLYTRRSDGTLCLMRHRAETVREEIEQKVCAMQGRLKPCDWLSEEIDLGFTIPRRYNDQYEMIRYFKNIYMMDEDFLRHTSFDSLFEMEFADGYIIHLLSREGIDLDQLQQQLDRINDPRVILNPASAKLDFESVIYEHRALTELLSQAEAEHDSVAAEELSYYLDDLQTLLYTEIDRLFGGGQRAMLLSAYHQPTRTSVNLYVSEVCATVYGQAPIICNELINKNTLTGIIRQSRERIIDFILDKARGYKVEAFSTKSAEATIYRAVLERPLLDTQTHVEDILNVIRHFINDCEVEKHSLQELYGTLTAAPFGMRKGCIPVYIAYVLREKLADAILYYGNKEMPLNGENFNICDKAPQSSFLLVQRGSDDRTAYLTILAETFLPSYDKNLVVSAAEVLKAINQQLRSMSKYTREYSQQLQSDGMLVPVNRILVQVRLTLMKFDANPGDILFVELPKLLNTLPNADCARQIIDIIDILADHMPDCERKLLALLKHAFAPNYLGSLQGAMQQWQMNLPTAVSNRLFDTYTNELIAFARNGTDSDDLLCLQKLALKLTQLSILDWSDQQLRAFLSQIQHSIETVVYAQREDTVATLSEGSFKIQIACSSGELVRSLQERDISPIGETLLNNLSSVMDEYAEALEPNETMQILTHLLLKQSERTGR